MALAIIISVVTTFSALGQPKINYVTSIERVKMADCLIIKKSIDKHFKVDCMRESK